MKVDIVWDGGTTKVILLEPLNIDGWEVPAGYESDGASVPRWLWPWCSPLDGRYIKIFVLHDWLYDNGIDREIADTVMVNLLINAGMRTTQAYAIYGAVRVFGGSHYTQKQDEGSLRP